MRFSVVIPCFNQGAFLKECLDSVARQTLPAAEVIVVDDGSTDPYTVARIDELCVGRVTRVRQANRGLSGARNAGIDASTGDWVLPLDADDQLTPDALTAYAQAIARDPSIDIWYPDIEEFGLHHKVLTPAEFDPWRLLWGNFMVCSSAIRRTVFEAGVRYDEGMRQGYEDWAFYVHACCERDFRGRRLGMPVFRYRRWGYSMINASDDRRALVIEQMRGERSVYRDGRRLDELKRAHSPFFAVAAGNAQVAAALERQSFRDARAIDSSGAVLRDADLAVFRAAPGANLLISIDDARLAHALEQDRYLLEKLALRLRGQAPGLVWLHRGERLAAVAPLSLFFARRALAISSGGLLVDLERHAVALHVPIYDICLAGPQVDAPPASAPIGWAERSRDRVLSAARDLSWRARDALGAELHDKLWQTRILKRALRVVDRAAIVAEDPSSEAGLRAGPVPLKPGPDEEVRLRMIAADEPRFSEVPGPAILVAVPRAAGVYAWLVRTLIAAIPARVLVLSATAQLDDEVDAFALPHLGGSDRPRAVAELVNRHQVRAVLLTDPSELCEALPAIARLEHRPRVLARLERIGLDSPGEQMAVRYNNLIDAYRLPQEQQDRIAGFCSRCYVSPSKVTAVRDGALAAELKALLT